MDPEFIDRIYECSFLPELWPGVLNELAQLASVPGAALFLTESEVERWVLSPPPEMNANAQAFLDAAAKFVNERWFNRGTIFPRLFAARHSGFLVDLDLLAADELEREPVIRDLMRPLGWGSTVLTAVPLTTGENAMFIMARPIGGSPFDRATINELDQVRPHLARSTLLAARLLLQQARVASETLSALGIPALVLNDQGKVLAANSLIEALADYVQWRAYDRVSLMDKAGERLFRDAIASINLSDQTVRSFPVRDAHGSAAMVAHVIPIRLSARDIFVRCATALILTPVTLPEAPPVELVQSLFDLTPTEAQVARCLASGETVNDLASRRGLSQSTVKTHVRRILEKTGCNRQTDVVALLTAISATRPANSS